MTVLLPAALCLTAFSAQAGVRDEEHLVADRMVKITVVELFEIMTVGPSDYDQMQVLSGADIEILAIAGDADSVALIGQPVVVARVFGSHTCEAGDAWLCYVVTLGELPMPEGPLSSCVDLSVSLVPGAVVLEEDSGSGEGEFWAWSPGKGFSETLD